MVKRPVSLRRPKPPKPPAVSVPKLWPGESVVIICCGPSLTQDDVTYCRGKARVIVVNDAYNYAPWADVLYACDAKFWRWEHEGKRPSVFQGNGLNAHTVSGLKYSLAPTNYPGVQALQNTGREGLELNPTGLKTGVNSGYQSLNLAIHLGAARILLLGYDMQKVGGRHHCFGDHPERSSPPFTAFVGYYAKLAPILQKRNIQVVNCSRHTALHCFPRQSLAQALPEPLEAAS